MILIVILSLLSVIFMTVAAYFFVPLKSVEPFVIQIDESTGVTEIVSSKKIKEYSANESLVKFFSMRYIYSRENYNFRLIDENNEVVRVMSSPEVFYHFRRYIDPANPGSPYNIFGTKIERFVALKSFSFLNKDSKKGENKIQARLIVAESMNGRAPIKYSVLVTLTAGFNPDLPLTEKERLINPLGFQVVSYRVDKEI